jgi:superfamily II DNA or RNA helicase
MSIDFKPLETVLSRHGYGIPKDELSLKELEKLKKDLTASPIQQGNFGGNSSLDFPIYLESQKRIYLPRYYGLTKYGKPRINKFKTAGTPAQLKFDGSLRPYQINIADIYLKAAKKIGGGIISIGCGRGKTVIGLYIAASLNMKTLVVVHKEFLAEQWKERILGDESKGIKGFLPTARVGLLQGKIIDVYDKDIVIAMVQSLSQKEYSETILKDFGLVIYDECHHLSAEVFSRALIKTSTKYTLGLSATPTRKDGLTYVFKYFLGETVYSESQNEDNTIMVRGLHYFNDDPSYCHIETNRMGDMNRPKMINNICANERRNKIILDTIDELIKDGRKVLVLSDRKEHLNYLKSKITNGSSGLYVGGMKQSDLKISEEKDIILGTYPMVSEGFDCPTLDTVILASPKSDVIQSVGRIMRKKPEDRDRQHIIIDMIDYFGNFAQQWIVRKKYYKKQKYQFEEFTYDDNSDETIIKNGTPKPIKQKTFKEELNEISFINEENQDNDDENQYNDNENEENEDNEED